MSNEQEGMTTAQLGSRVDRLDDEMQGVKTELGDLKTSTTRATAVVEGMRGDLTGLFTKLDRVSETTGHPGMVPISYIWSGLGLLLTLATIGISVTVIAGTIVLWAMSSNADKDDLRMSSIEAEASDLEAHQESTLVLMKDTLLDRQERLIAQAETLARYDERIKQLEAHDTSTIGGYDQKIQELAALQEKVKWARQEIDDHKDKADHPLMQAEAIKSLKSDIDRITNDLSDSRGNVQRIDAEGSAMWKSNQEEKP